MRDLLRNRRRTLATLTGIVLGVGLFSGILFFIDGSGSSMTKRAIAPVAIDMQRVMTSPLGEGLRLEQALPQRNLKLGQQTRVELVVSNRGASTEHDVVVKDDPPAGLAYVPGSSRVNGEAIGDRGGESPFAHGPAAIGRTLGDLGAGERATISYRVEADGPFAAAPEPWATVASREKAVPERANLPDLVPLAELRRLIAAVEGVASAHELGFASLPPGSLAANGTTVGEPVKIFGFDGGYADAYGDIELIRGGFEPGSAVLSSEAAADLGVGPGDRVEVSIPGADSPAPLIVSGIADLSRARELFQSRQGLKLEDFLYVPNSLVVDPAAFLELVVPAYRTATAERRSALAVKSPPTLEVDIRAERAPLDSDPGRALAQTEATAERVSRIAPDQDFMLDNISNTLTVAKQDAAVAKRMFLFLGLPGLILAGFLAAYAGAILAAAQRREQANLRLRGAGPRQLRRILLFRTGALAGVGSALGMLLGLLSALAVLGGSALFEAAPSELARSAAISVAAGILTTGLALYLPGRRALSREVSGERREMATEVEPRWRRWRLDFVALAALAVGSWMALRSGSFSGTSANVKTGESTSLASHLLLLPLGAWITGVSLGMRGSRAVAHRLPVPRAPSFGGLLRGILTRSLSRRSAALLIGVGGVGLVIAFGVGLAVFTSTYEQSKAADARFTVGADLRVSPSPASDRPHPKAYAEELDVGGVAAVAPVIAGVENTFVRSAFNSDVKDLAALDAAAYMKTAPLSDEFFPETTAAEALAALGSTADGVLLDSESADGLKLEVGDHAKVLLARGSKNQQLRKVEIVGLFDRLPGFPEGINIAMNLDYYSAETGLEEVDFFLLTTMANRDVAAASAAIADGPAAADRLAVETTETTFNKEQSSLTALNVRGLVDLDSAFTLAMSVAVIFVFIFGLMLQRRREYVVLRAQGLPSAKLRGLIVGEAGFVALLGFAAGAVVGVAMGLLLVNVLDPLFILAPTPAMPWADGATLGGLLLGATTIASIAAFVAVSRLRPSEVLRES